MPLPVELDFGTNSDANGNASVKQVIRGAYWTVVYCTAQCAGAGQWVFGKTGTPIVFQQGANVVLGPVFLAPNQEAQLQLVGGQANSPVSGTFWGFQGQKQDGSDLVALAPTLETAGSLAGSVALSLAGNVPVINAGGTRLSTLASDITLGTQHQPNAAGGSATTVITPDPGAKSIVVTVTKGTMTALSITGNTTSGTYFSRSGLQIPGSGVPIVIPFVPQGSDTAFTVSGTYSSIADALITESFAVVPPFLQEVEMQFSSPAPWQGPNQSNDYQELTAAGTAVLRAGVAGQTIRVFAYNVEIEATANISGFIQDNSRVSPANRIIPFGAIASTFGMISGNRYGDPLPLGAGLVLNFALGTGTVRASVSCSQA